jgi:hypothetical protein
MSQKRKLKNSNTNANMLSECPILSKVTFSDFKKSWEEQITKIETRALDNDAVSRISLHFDLDKLHFQMSLDEEEKEETDVLIGLNMLESKLQIALETANSRFRLENRGIWAKAFNGIFDKVGKK